MSQKLAVYPGTFDPITIGHLDVIIRAGRLFDTVIIAIAENNRKHTLFSLQERIDMLRHEIELLPSANYLVKSFSGLLIDFAEQEKAVAIIRGIRAVSDFEYEFKMSYVNSKLNPHIDTVFLPASSAGHFISSTFAKEIAFLGGSVESFVPPYVETKLREKREKIA